MRRSVLLVLLPLSPLLSGCGESDDERAARHHAMCRSYGANFGTPEYVQCRATVHQTELRRRREQEDAAMQAAILSTTIAVGASGGR